MDTDVLQRLDSFLSDPGVPQEDKNRAVAMARVADQPTTDPTTTDTPTSGPGFGAAQYLTHKGSQFVGAVQGVGKDVENLVTGQPYGTGFPGNDLSHLVSPDYPPSRTLWDTAGDVATTAAPIVAPEATALGLTTGAYARAKGADEPTADLVNAGTQLITGLTQAGKAAAGLKPWISKQFGNVADTMAQRGTLLTAGSPEGQGLFWDLGKAMRRFAPGSAEKQAATGIMKSLARGTSLTYGDIDDALTAVQGLSKDSKIAGILRTARDAMTAGTPEEATLARAGAWSRASRAQLPFANVARTVLGGTGLGAAGLEAYRGNYGRAAALAALGLTGAEAAGGSVGHALVAAGPLARTAVSVGGLAAPGLAGKQDQGYTEPPVSVPPETPPEAGGSPGPQAPRAAAPTPIRPLPGPYGREIAAVASLVGVPAPLIQSHMKVESGGNAGAIGDQGRSIGLMQIQPGTAVTVAKHAGELLGRAPDLKNPLDNLLVGGLLLRRYLDQTNGDVGAAAQKYNGGEATSGNAMTRQYAGKIIDTLTGGG